MRVGLGARGRRLIVEVPEGPVGAFLDGIYRPFRLPDPPGTTIPDLTVEEGGGGWLFRSARDERTVRLTSTRAVLVELEYGIASFLLRQLHDFTHLHGAAAVLPGGGAVLALGKSGSGKSTLAMSWSLLGLPLLGDDILLLGDDGGLRAFPRPVKVPAAILRTADTAHAPPMSETAGAPEAWFDADAAGGWAEGPVRAGATVELRPGPGLRLEERGLAETLSVLMGSVLDTGASPARSLPRLLELAGETRGYSLSFDDAFAAARVVLEHAK